MTREEFRSYTEPVRYKADGKRDRTWKGRFTIFAPNTEAAWGLRFDDVLADALELGPLRSPDISFSPELEQRIQEGTPKGVPTEVLRTLIGYYLVNRQEDTDWVVLPVISFDACFGRNFSRKWPSALPESVIVRGRDKGRGVCRYKVEKILR